MINEIRIGSWLFGTDKTKKQVTSHGFPHVIAALNNKTAMPIPLKEETLMKVTPMINAPNNKVAFHFTLNTAWTLRLMKSDYYWSCHLAFMGQHDVAFYPHLKNIEYVHQLQNLVLDLFGIELVLEP